MENKTNNISHLVFDVCSPGEIAEDNCELKVFNIYKDGEYIGQLEASSEEDAIDQAYSGAFGFVYSDNFFEAEEETNGLIDDYVVADDEDEEDYDEYESLYSNGYGFMSMHKHSQPMKHFKNNKRGDK